jgi:hypothetical protein
MRQLSNVSRLSRVLFMGLLIGSSAAAQSSPISPLTPPSGVIDVAPNDAVAQAIQAILAPGGSIPPQPAISPRHQRVDVSRAVIDFYAQRSFRAAWTNDRDVAQLLKSLNDTQVDGLDPGELIRSPS